MEIATTQKIKPADKEEYQSFMNKLKEMIRNALEQKADATSSVKK